ncbi:hypothetical protein ACIQ9Q_38550 [Streptomyces sp. NPDC094438]|uniref:hypothetical protein n=1 Tax=Streptomyces sp. NPDC094438 TaxID=3366061 RepID=UPI00382DD003
MKSTAYKAGYTATIRPPVSVTGPEKTANPKSYGYTGSIGDAEYNHLISLALGAHPVAARNAIATDWTTTLVKLGPT